jgi:membrane-associated phospholipid phosphatase
LEAGVEEAGDSRVYAGIHYRSDVNGGRILGRAVGNWSLNYDHTQGLLTAVGR